MPDTDDDSVTIVMDNDRYNLAVVGRASRNEQPYLRLGESDGNFLASLDPDAMYVLRDALTRALRGWDR